MSHSSSVVCGRYRGPSSSSGRWAFHPRSFLTSRHIRSHNGVPALIGLINQIYRVAHEDSRLWTYPARTGGRAPGVRSAVRCHQGAYEPRVVTAWWSTAGPGDYWGRVMPSSRMALEGGPPSERSVL